MGNLSPEAESRVVIFRMTVAPIQTGQLGATSSVLCFTMLTRQEESRLSLDSALWSDGTEFCPTWFMFLRWSGVWLRVLLWEFWPCKSSRAPNRENSRAGRWKGPLLPSPCPQQPSLGDTFLLPLTSAAFSSTHPLAIPTTGHCFWLPPQGSLPVTHH